MSTLTRLLYRQCQECEGFGATDGIEGGWCGDCRGTGMVSRDWKAYGVGIGFRPFWWRLGLSGWAGTRYLSLGPLFFAWHKPGRERRRRLRLDAANH